MPIIAREPNIYPDDFLEPTYQRDSVARGLLLYTRPRQEKALARDLLRLCLPFYLPLVPQRSQVRGRVVTSHIPLFSGYMFACVRDEQRLDLLRTNRLSQVIAVDDEQQLACELRHVEFLIASEKPVTIERRLEAGTRVRVKTGPLKGLEGVVACRRGKERLILAVTLLQQGASIEIDDFQVEPT